MHLQPRGLVKGQVLAIDAGQVRIKVTLGGGRGSSEQRIPLERVRLIDFAPLAGEAELLDAGLAASKTALTQLWARKRAYLGQPNSNAGAVGLLLGEILLASPDAEDHANARNLYTIIEGGDWDAKRRARARRGRLDALVKTGAAAEVLSEAKKIADEGGDPALLLAAEHVLAQAELAGLRQLIAESPKWREDDYAKPKVEALYQNLLDRFLKPFLFYGTEGGAATRGLLATAEIYELIERPERAHECYRDIVILYPETAAASEAEAALRKIPIQANEENEPKE